MSGMLTGPKRSMKEVGAGEVGRLTEAGAVARASQVVWLGVGFEVGRLV